MRGKTKMIVSISCDILCQFHLIVDYFLRFTSLRFSHSKGFTTLY